MSGILPMTYANTSTTPQHPIGSGFAAETTAAEVIRVRPWAIDRELAASCGI